VPDPELSAVSVRPILLSERVRFDKSLDEHHWLGHHLVGETMRYVALGGDGQWLAVLGFGAAALACKARDRFIGWSDDQHFRRLKFVTDNQRYCILPEGRIPNLATNVLGKTLARLSSDFESRWCHQVVMVETYVDPSRLETTDHFFGRLGERGPHELVAAVAGGEDEPLAHPAPLSIEEQPEPTEVDLELDAGRRVVDAHGRLALACPTALDCEARQRARWDLHPPALQENPDLYDGEIFFHPRLDLFFLVDQLVPCLAMTIAPVRTHLLDHLADQLLGELCVAP
jgi:hypothetical protein